MKYESLGDILNKQANRFIGGSVSCLPPLKLIYIPELVRYYQLAMAAELPSLEFLSYYHILEHFFTTTPAESVTITEQLKTQRLSDIRVVTTEPGFCIDRDSDVEKLFAIVKKHYPRGAKEQRCLLQTLEKHVDLTKVRDLLSTLAKGLPEYYKTTTVSFAKGCLVDLIEGKAAYRQLARRIYSVRNSIVHRKANHRYTYRPFVDDEELSYEVQLMRIIAEQVILNTAREIDLGLV